MIPVENVTDNYGRTVVRNAVIIRDLIVLSVRQEVRNCSVTYRQRLNDHPNNLAKSRFQKTTLQS